MSFDHDLFQSEYRQHLTVRLGTPVDQAERLAAMASEAICLTHGGGKHYIQTRRVNSEAIRTDHQAGRSISQLSRHYGISAEQIRQIVR